MDHGINPLDCRVKYIRYCEIGNINNFKERPGGWRKAVKQGLAFEFGASSGSNMNAAAEELVYDMCSYETCRTSDKNFTVDALTVDMIDYRVNIPILHFCDLISGVDKTKARYVNVQSSQHFTEVG